MITKQWAVVEFIDRHSAADFLGSLDPEQQRLAKISASDSVLDDDRNSYTYTRHYWHIFYPINKETK